MMLSPVEQGHGCLAGMRHTITHVVVRRTRSAFAKVGRVVTPAANDARLVPYHWDPQFSRHWHSSGMARDLRTMSLFPA